MSVSQNYKEASHLSNAIAAIIGVTVLAMPFAIWFAQGA